MSTLIYTIAVIISWVLLYYVIKAAVKNGIIAARNYNQTDIISDSKQTVFRETTDDKILKIVSKPNQTIGSEVFIDDLPASDGIYNYKSGTHKLIIENGKIKERFFIKNYKDFYVEQKQDNFATIGDKVYSLDNKLIPDGKYSLGFASGEIIVENGIINK